MFLSLSPLIICYPAHHLATKLTEAVREYRSQRESHQSFTASLGDKPGKWQELIDEWNRDPDCNLNPFEYPTQGSYLQVRTSAP